MLATRLVVGALEESGDPNGEKAERGPGAIMSSGFGGLGLEGMVGMSEPAAGVGKTPPGEGSSGAMSGDSSWKGDSEEGDGGGSVNVAGEDESVGTLGIGSCEYDERRGEGMKAMMMIMSFR